MVSAIIGLLAPIATTLLTHYLKPKIKPVMEAVVEVETVYQDVTNANVNYLKHGALRSFIISNPAIMKFVNKCGWKKEEINVIIKFAVLMVKKSPDNVDNRDKWNDDDLKTLFDFLRIIAGKWIPMLRGKK